MWSVARRPRWIAMLVLALAVAAGFAALGQWQLERSIASGTVVERDTETVRALDEVATPQEQMPSSLAGQVVEASGRFVDGDYLTVSGRVNDGVEGYWVVGHLQTDGASPAALAVALGWAPTEREATSAIAGLPTGSATVTGRYLPGEAPQLTDFEKGERSTLSAADLINVWPDFSGDVYSGYLVSHDEAAGLDLIDSPTPTTEVSLNWLNLFYAAEWAVFAGFAVFMWYRLVKDAWEREVELAAEVN